MNNIVYFSEPNREQSNSVAPWLLGGGLAVAGLGVGGALLSRKRSSLTPRERVLYRSAKKLAEEDSTDGSITPAGRVLYRTAKKLAEED